jgi:hypothetical protein
LPRVDFFHSFADPREVKFHAWHLARLGARLRKRCSFCDFGIGGFFRILANQELLSHAAQLRRAYRNAAESIALSFDRGCSRGNKPGENNAKTPLARQRSCPRRLRLRCYRSDHAHRAAERINGTIRTADNAVFQFNQAARNNGAAGSEFRAKLRRNVARTFGARSNITGNPAALFVGDRHQPGARRNGHGDWNAAQ